MTDILMPALSPTMEEGTLAKWFVKVGDTVKSGDVIAEIETDKATMEVEAVDEGTLGKILVAAGSEGVKVNTPIAVLLQEGESADAAAKPKAEAQPAKTEDAPKAEAAADRSGAGRSGRRPRSRVATGCGQGPPGDASRAGVLARGACLGAIYRASQPPSTFSTAPVM